MFKVIIEDRKLEARDNTSIEDLIKSNFDYKDIVAAKINNNLCDLSDLITSDCNIELIKSSNNKGLEIIRHTCAHLFGHAIKQIYPDTKMVIGPVIDNGFYYDIDTKETISEKNLSSIELLMKKLAKKKYKIIKEIVTKDKAAKIFSERNESYKLKLIKEIPNNEIISIYHHEEYIDKA